MPFVVFCITLQSRIVWPQLAARNVVKCCRLRSRSIDMWSERFNEQIQPCVWKYEKDPVAPFAGNLLPIGRHTHPHRGKRQHYTPKSVHLSACWQCPSPNGLAQHFCLSEMKKSQQLGHVRRLQIERGTNSTTLALQKCNTWHRLLRKIQGLAQFWSQRNHGHWLWYMSKVRWLVETNSVKTRQSTEKWRTSLSLLSSTFITPPHTLSRWWEASEGSKVHVVLWQDQGSTSIMS